MIGLGIVGLGGMGAQHARAAEAAGLCSVVVGYDVSEQARAAFAQRFPHVTLHRTLRAVLRDTRVDAVVVAVPTGHHAEVVIRALKSGRHVLVEKPMARTVAECRRMNEAARKAKKELMVAHCRRFDSHWGSWGKIVTSGGLGRPVIWRHLSAGLGPGRWFMDDRLGGGPLLDGAVHNYDFANMLFGHPDTVVSSTLKLDPDVTAVDTGSTVVRYASGDQLLLSWSWGARGCRLFDVVGPRGFIQLGTGNVTPPESQKGTHNYCCLTDAEGKEHVIRARTTPRMLDNQMKHFLQCIQGKARCASPGTEAIKAVAVAEAVLKAGPRGKARPVRW